MIPTIEDIVAGLLAGTVTAEQAIGWLRTHQEVVHPAAVHEALPDEPVTYLLAIDPETVLPVVSREDYDALRQQLEQAIQQGKELQESAWNLGVATGKKKAESELAAERQLLDWMERYKPSLTYFTPGTVWNGITKKAIELEWLPDGAKKYHFAFEDADTIREAIDAARSRQGDSNG